MPCCSHRTLSLLHTTSCVYLMLVLVMDPLNTLRVASSCPCGDHDVSTNAVAVAATAVLSSFACMFALNAVDEYYQHAYGHKHGRLSMMYTTATVVAFGLSTTLAPLTACMQCGEQSYLALLWDYRFAYALYIAGGAAATGLVVVITGVLIVIWCCLRCPDPNDHSVPPMSWLADSDTKPPLSAVAMSQLDELNITNIEA